MISEIFLHIGLPKTATSSIQHTLFSKKNSEILQDNNYLYPKTWPVGHNHPIYSNFCDHPEEFYENTFRGYNVEEIKKVNEGFLQSLEKEIKKTTCSKLIISAESISVLTSDNLLNLQNYFLSICGKQVKFNIMIYVRNPISHSTSIIQQQCKYKRSEQSALQIVVGNRKKFQESIEKFIEVFGSESIKVYSFEESIKHKFGPVGYFLAALNLNHEEISRFHYIKHNEGLSLFAVKFLSYVQMKMPLAINGKLQKNRTMNDIDPIFNIKGPRYDLSQTDKKTIVENRHDDVIWLKNNYRIDYSSPSFGENQINFEITEEIVHDLKNIFSNLADPLKLLLIEFLQQHVDSLNDEKNKILILNLLGEFKNYKKQQLRSEKFLVTGFKILSKILPDSTSDKIRGFYLNKLNSS